MKIGNIELRHGLFLAPMAGVTDHAFRALCVSCGAECVTGELISAKGVTYGDKKTDTLAALYPNERPAAIQLFGHEPDILARAAAEIMRFSPDFIDINMGCPVPKLVRNGDGSALMRDPELCERIVYAVCEAADVPVTVKIRKGCDDEANAPEVAKRCEAGGASAVFVHGRTRAQMYSGRADREIIARVKDAVSIPVIGNGDVDSVESYMDMKERTGCDGVMIGRAAEGAPWLFSEITARLEGRRYAEPDYDAKRRMIIRQLETVIAEKGERGICEFRHHLLQYCRGFNGSAKLRAEISRVSTRTSALAAIRTIFS